LNPGDFVGGVGGVGQGFSYDLHQHPAELAADGLDHGRDLLGAGAPTFVATSSREGAGAAAGIGGGAEPKAHGGLDDGEAEGGPVLALAAGLAVGGEAFDSVLGKDGGGPLAFEGAGGVVAAAGLEVVE